jgi:hypothetical protein
LISSANLAIRANAEPSALAASVLLPKSVRILPSASVARVISPERPDVLAATASVNVLERPMLTPLESTFTETCAGSEAENVITPSLP